MINSAGLIRLITALIRDQFHMSFKDSCAGGIILNFFQQLKVKKVAGGEERRAVLPPSPHLFDYSSTNLPSPAVHSPAKSLIDTTNMSTLTLALHSQSVKKATLHYCSQH